MKRYVAWVVVMMIMLTGCSTIAVSSSVPRLTGVEYFQNDFSIYSDEELSIRSTFESVRIYSEYLKDHAIDKGDETAEYGIDNFWRYGDYIYFETLEEMRIVLGNHDFRRDFTEQYSLPTVRQYYLPKDINTKFFGSNLLVSNGERYFELKGISVENDKFIQWGVYDISNQMPLGEVLNFYASLDDLLIENAVLSDGTTVYYCATRNSTLFSALEFLPAEKPYTAYLWQQDNVIGVLILPGEHQDENLDLCVLERHEI